MSALPANTGTALAKRHPELVKKLSEAQLKVLEYLLEGHSEPKIAEYLNRSRHTVHDHTKAIYQALGVNGRVQLVLMFSAPVKN